MIFYVRQKIVLCIRKRQNETESGFKWTLQSRAKKESLGQKTLMSCCFQQQQHHNQQQQPSPNITKTNNDHPSVEPRTFKKLLQTEKSKKDE